MNLRQIEIFHAVYTNGSVSAAARALNISQPAVTNTLRHAERQIGFPLFDRTKGRLIPTEDAHTLFGDVAEIQHRVDALRQAGQNMRHGRSGVLRISTLPALGLGVIAEAVAEFLAERADVSFDLEIVHHDDMVRKLYERETDIVIGNQRPVSMPIADRWLGEGELGILYREEDIADAPPRLTLDALDGRPFISPQRGSAFGTLLYAELDRQGRVLDEAISARTFYIAAALVRAGVGITVVDNFTAHAMLRPGLAFRPLQPPVAFDVYAIYLESRPPSALAITFLETLGRAIDRL
jgi:DNA-binding transcriptional LysR family regulator